MFIRTERLFLRPGWIEDAPELSRAMAHEPVTRMLARLGHADIAAAARVLLEPRRGWRLPSLLVTLPEDAGRIVGGCFLHERGGRAEVAYWIGPAEWGRGYGRAALRGLIAVARMLGHRELIGRHTLDSSRAAGVLLDNGFSPAVRSRSGQGAGCLEYELKLPAARPGRPNSTLPAAYGARLSAAANLCRSRSSTIALRGGALRGGEP